MTKPEARMGRRRLRSSFVIRVSLVILVSSLVILALPTADYASTLPPSQYRIDHLPHHLVVDLREIQGNHRVPDARCDQLPRRGFRVDFLREHAGLLALGEDAGEEVFDLPVMLAHHRLHLLVATRAERA